MLRHLLMPCFSPARRASYPGQDEWADEERRTYVDLDFLYHVHHHLVKFQPGYQDINPVSSLPFSPINLSISMYHHVLVGALSALPAFSFAISQSSKGGRCSQWVRYLQRLLHTED